MKLSTQTLIALLAFAGVAQAQTRDTPCDPKTPNNAICVIADAPTTFTEDGAVINKPLTYRIEQRTGTSGTWVTVQSGLTIPRAYIQNLAQNTYQFRVFANCTPSCAESGPSNTANGIATAVITTPNPPVITIAVVITSNRAPVYRIVGKEPNAKRGEFFGLIPVGRICMGPVVFKYRAKSFRRVSVLPTELWGTSDVTDLAAPCA